MEEDFGGDELLCVVSMRETAAQTKDEKLFMTGVSYIYNVYGPELVFVFRPGRYIFRV